MQNALSALQCFSTAGGVKCKKFGIFISSKLAYFVGGTPFLLYPCLTGRGTTYGLKLLGPTHKLVQSTSSKSTLVIFLK